MDTSTDIILNACMELTGANPDSDKLYSGVGRWLRFAAAHDRKGQKSCALKLHDHGDYYVGIVKDHKTGATLKFTTRTSKPSWITPEERAQMAQRRREWQCQEQKRSARKHRMLSGMSQCIWTACAKPEQWDKPHPYVVRKQVQPYNMRRWVSHKHDYLVLPMVEPLSGQIMSLYLIYANGFKRPLKGSQPKGQCMAIGRHLNTAPIIWIVEGWATGATLHEQTGEPVIVAFTAGNLEPVTKKITHKYPHAKIKLCCDDDRKTERKTGTNPGLTYARKAQQACPQISLYKPLFPPDAPQGLSDVNDLVNYERGVSHG